ncbi:MAG: PepSY-like domain-containing protein [Saprospiraceae bacterium]
MKKSLLLIFALAAWAVFQFAACEEEGNFPLGDLPASIKTYVDANYPGYTLDEAETETDCFGTSVYEVEIEQGEENDLELTFDTAGAFLYSETEIVLPDLPASVTSAIASKYGGFKIEEASKLNMADGSTRYELDLEKGSTNKEVLFDTEGTVICEKDEE